FEQALQASSELFRSKLWLANVAVALVAGFSALRVVGTQRQPFYAYATPIWIGTCIIYGWSAASLIWTPSFEKAYEIITWGLPYFVVFILIAPVLLQGIESVGSYARALLYGGTLIVLLLVLNPEFTATGGRFGFQIEGQVRSSPLAIGELGGTLIIVAALLRQGPHQALLNVARIAAFTMGAVLALQSGSRGQLLFAVVVALTFYPISKKLKSLPTFIGTVIGAAVIVPAVFFVAQAVLLSEGTQRWDAVKMEEGVSIRFANALDLLGAFVTNPAAWIFGLGANGFSSISATTAGEGYVHNICVETISELGLPMFALFALLLAATTRQAFWLFRRYSDSPRERASLSVLLALAAYQFLLVNKQGNLWSNGMVFVYMIFIAKLHKLTQTDDDEILAIESGESHDAEPIAYS
ncbi:MAG: hypothetical protein JNK53_02575, partial [Phycisphaerae bacterium]|nr:hypothetical protein [Phycisphaerae bacterium]